MFLHMETTTIPWHWFVCTDLAYFLTDSSIACTMVKIKNTGHRRRRLASSGMSKLSSCVGWERYRCIDPPPSEEITTTNKPPTVARDTDPATPPADHQWDDVVHAIRDDLRAFWGLWESDIAPRLDPGLPVTYEVAAKWKGGDVDLADVFSRLRCLTRQVRTITDNYVPTSPDEQRIQARVKSLLTDSEKEYKGYQCLFIHEMLVCAQMPGFVYPRPVD